MSALSQEHAALLGEEPEGAGVGRPGGIVHAHEADGGIERQLAPGGGAGVGIGGVLALNGVDQFQERLELRALHFLPTVLLKHAYTLIFPEIPAVRFSANGIRLLI